MLRVVHVGVYGDVQRVKILYNKKDSALIQMAEPHQAHLGNCLFHNLHFFFEIGSLFFYFSHYWWSAIFHELTIQKKFYEKIVKLCQRKLFISFVLKKSFFIKILINFDRYQRFNDYLLCIKKCKESRKFVIESNEEMFW